MEEYLSRRNRADSSEPSCKRLVVASYRKQPLNDDFPPGPNNMFMQVMKEKLEKSRHCKSLYRNRPGRLEMAKSFGRCSTRVALQN